MPAPSLIAISAIYPKQLKAEMGKDKPLCTPWALCPLTSVFIIPALSLPSLCPLCLCESYFCVFCAFLFTPPVQLNPILLLFNRDEISFACI